MVIHVRSLEAAEPSSCPQFLRGQFCQQPLNAEFVVRTAGAQLNCSFISLEELKMGLETENDQAPQRKLKLLGLHSFRTSADIFKRQLTKWSPSLHELFDVDYINGPLPCSGKSDVEGIFEGPYYEWYRFKKDYTEFYYVDENLLSYISNYMKLHGPYDGILGFSQGACLGGYLAAIQEKGVGLQDVSPLRVLVLIAPAKLRAQHLKHVYDDPKIKCPTLALIGARDPLRIPGFDVLKSFENHIAIEHRFGHTVPRLDDTQTATVAQFLKSQLDAITSSTVPPESEAEASQLVSDAIDKVEDVKSLSGSILTDSQNEVCSAA